MNTSASKVQHIKEKRVRIPDKRAKGYDKRVWVHGLVLPRPCERIPLNQVKDKDPNRYQGIIC